MLTSVATFKVLVIAGIAVGTIGGGALALVLGADSRRSEPAPVTAQPVPPQPATVAQPKPIQAPIELPRPAPSGPLPVAPAPARKVVSTPGRTRGRTPGSLTQSQTAAINSAPRVWAPGITPDGVVYERDPKVLYDLGRKVLYEGNVVLSIDYFERSYASDPTSETLFALATAHGIAGAWPIALKQAKQILETTKGTPLGEKAARLAERARAYCAEWKYVCE